MSDTIWKWEIPLSRDFTLEMPVGAEILSVQTQNLGPRGEEGMVWARVDPQASTAARRFRLAVTGGRCPDGGSYVGTYQLSAGEFVGHLFEVGV